MKNIVRILSTLVLALCVTINFSSCDKKTQLEIGVAAANADCPMDCGGGMVITSIEIDGDNVVYYCSVDEYESGIADIQDLDNPFVKAAMVETMSQNKAYDKDVQTFMQALKETGTDIIFRFVGIHTGDVVNIFINPYEL